MAGAAAFMVDTNGPRSKGGARVLRPALVFGTGIPQKAGP